MVRHVGNKKMLKVVAVGPALMVAVGPALMVAVGPILMVAVGPKAVVAVGPTPVVMSMAWATRQRSCDRRHITLIEFWTRSICALTFGCTLLGLCGSSRSTASGGAAFSAAAAARRAPSRLAL